MTTPSLLLHCDGSDGGTTFIDSSPNAHTITVNSVTTESAQKKFGTSSARFDASGDYLFAPYHTDFAMGTGDFTVEMWIYRTGSEQNHTGLFGFGDPATGGWIGDFAIAYNTGNYWWWIGGSGQSLIWNGGVPAGWTHIAVARESGTLHSFLNGVLQTSVACTKNIDSGDGLLFGNWAAPNANYSTQMYMDEIRVVKGEALYTSTFTPPDAPYATEFFTVSLEYKNAGGSFAAVTSALGDVGADITPDAGTAYWDDPGQDRAQVEISNAQVKINAEPDTGNTNEYTLGIVSASQLMTSDAVGSIGDVKVEYAFSQVYAPVLLLHMDGANGSTTFTDSSSSAHILTTHGDAQVSTTAPKFGSGSLLLDGTGDYLTAPHSTDFTFAGDFTIDLWIKLTATAHSAFIATSNGSGNVPGFYLWQHLNGTLYFQITAGAPNGFEFNITGAGFAIDSTWHHLAAVRSGSTITVYKDGVAFGSSNYTLPVNSSNGIGIGGDYTGGLPQPGNIDEVRIVNGEAVWTSNFTPPTSPF